MTCVCAPSPREILSRVHFGARKGECQQIFRVGGGDGTLA